MALIPRPRSLLSPPPTGPIFWIRLCCVPAASTAKSWSIARPKRARGDPAGSRQGKPLSPDVDLDEIAAQTPGLVGADLENLINEAAILAARRNKRSSPWRNCENRSNGLWRAGPAQPCARRTGPEDDRLSRGRPRHRDGDVAHTDLVNKITIVSRGQALGYAMPLPEQDRSLKSRRNIEDEMVGLLGGRVAEEIIFDEPSTGAANDLERVTKLAKMMVTSFGMSEVIGPMQLQQSERATRSWGWTSANSGPIAKISPARSTVKCAELWRKPMGTPPAKF